MAKLALAGGKPLSKTGYQIKWPVVTEADVKAVERVARTGEWWRYDGREVEKFEKEFGKYHDAGNVLGVSNGTVAIEIALRACGIEPGDEVIVPAVTFIASASAVLMARAVPVFADIVEDTCQIDPADVKKKLTPRTKAIVVVHYAGYPVDMDAIMVIARKHKLRVVEDCAHAQGSEWHGRKVGAIGDIGTFSFQQSKSLTCGEGGAVITDSAELYNNAYAYHHIGRTLNSEKYQHTIVGPNYRITEFQGAILRTQLRKLQAQTLKRMENAARLTAALADIPGLEPLKKDSRITQRGYYFHVLSFDSQKFGLSRDTFLDAMAAEGAPLGVGYGAPVYQLPVFREMSFGRSGCPLTCGHYKGKMNYAEVTCPVAEKVSRNRHVTVQNDILLTERNIDLIARAVIKVSENRAELT
ncbi:MAG: DegT/DnrJ/EryC1/StrS family aminotransferase [Candidatus Glassbacteria bacterium]|nr:DegT/DnrJ/EryC1/StrS family aminotransferase [Candidatus Glassbacteria bacterium]